MRRELGQLLVLTALGFTSLPSVALESDASAPIEIAADQLGVQVVLADIARKRRG